MIETTIPDSLCDDLKEYFLAEVPIGMEIFTADRLRLKHAEGEPPSPRIEILVVGEPKRVPSMDGTQRIPITIKLASSMNATTQPQHQRMARELELWWMGLRTKRRTDPLTRLYLHDLLVTPMTTQRDAEKAEQWSLLKAEAIVTAKVLP